MRGGRGGGGGRGGRGMSRCLWVGALVAGVGRGVDLGGNWALDVE